MATRQELFMQSYMRRVAERQAKKYIAVFCQGMPVEDFRYAAENDINIVGDLLKRFLLKPGEEKVARKKAQPYRKLVEDLATTETVIRIFNDVSPEHGKILQQHPSWIERQLRSAMSDVFRS